MANDEDRSPENFSGVGDTAAGDGCVHKQGAARRVDERRTDAVDGDDEEPEEVRRHGRDHRGDAAVAGQSHVDPNRRPGDQSEVASHDAENGDLADRPWRDGNHSRQGCGLAVGQ